MAQYYNVVTNPNGTFNIQLEDIQQLCSIDGQNVLLVEDINNGANLISQQIVTYASAPDNTEQTLFSQPTINLGAHVATAQLETRPSVYIIKTNDPPMIQQTIFNKSSSGNSKLQDDSNSKGSKDQINVCYTQPFSTRENNETFELVIKEDPTPVKNIITNTVRNQQPVSTQSSTPNVLIQGNAEKKITRLIPINKRPSVGSPTIGILKTTAQGSNSQPAKVGKMKRNSNLANPPNVTLPTRPRASTGGVSTTNQLATPRTPQARPPIHSDASQRNSLSLSKNPTNQQFPEMGQLSERIRQATLKQRQQQNEQRQKQQQPVMAVTPMQRIAQSAQAPVQRQRVMGQLLTLNRQQLQLQQQHQQQQQLQQQQQQLQQEHMLQRQQPAAVIPVSQQSQQVQVSIMTENAEPMEVDSSENVQSERLNQINCTAKNEMEENSSESFAYLQQEIDDPHTAIVQHQIQGNEAKMLVILENGEQRLITFEVPKEDCTVQDLLEQANIFSSQEPHVSLVSDPALGINYIVDVTAKSSIHEEDHAETSPSSEGSSVTTISEPKTPVKNTNPPVMPHVPVSPRVPKYVSGMLAVCSFCGMSAADFNYCMRCKRKLPENVKAISISSGSATKKEAIAPDTFYKKTEPSLPHKPDREAISKRGRGRGGRTSTRTRQVKEPECLTISSDEEDDNRKQKRLGDGKEIVNSQNSVTEEAETILEKEPVITNNSVSPTIVHLPNSQQPLSGGRELGTQDIPTSNLNTFLTCRTVRIGSYKYVPNDKIVLSSDGIKLDVPLLEDDKTSITVDIKFCNLVKVLIHFAKSMPVLFFYTNVATGKSIREILGMQDPKGPYFDPAGKDHTHKRITLLPERISEDSKTILKELYKPIFDELNTKEANDILVRASPKTKTQVQTPVKKPTSTGSSSCSSTSTNSNGVIQTITVYPPPPAKGGIAINTEDYICLAEDQFLNDVIIDFYLKYLTLEKLSEDDHNRTHVFSSYFYKRLTSPHAQAVENPDKLSPEAKRHARVQKWTKNVNIFEKDFIVIPINEHAHWFLAIVCFPGLVGTVTPKVEVKTENQKLPDKKKKDSKSLTIGNTTITPVSTITIDTNDDGSERDEAEGDDEEMETDSDDDDDETDSNPNSEEITKTNCQTSETKEVTKVPCILIFDSLAGASRSRVVATLRDYLSCEYKAKMGAEKVFSKDTIKGACPKVPQQSNFTDCGLYVLQYVESFFENPLMDYTLPIKTLKTWFEEIIVTRKREEIAKLLIELVENTKGNKTITLPNLTFPTQDGKLKQKPDSQTETRAAKLEAEVKKKAAEAAESKLNTATSTTEKEESSNESSSKVGISQTTIPQSVNQITCTTDGNIIIQKEATTSTNARSPAETMAFLKTKRIPRLQKSSDNQDDKQVAKKHKGESFDSCK